MPWDNVVFKLTHPIEEYSACEAHNLPADNTCPQLDDI
jgi:hypothetical protein